MEAVNEQTTAELTVTLFATDGNPQAPISLTYTIHDVGRLGTLTEVKGTTTVSNPQGVNTVPLTATDNTILNSGGRDEIRRVTFTATYGANDKLIFSYDYQVLNIDTVT